ncbi:MAG: hypothetical protein ACP5IM_02110 [Candidatus Bathyarchaeia archaeon]|nr:MAG: hypothetical protein C0195_00620 [Candidatus Bathyarchaeota archaeon]
MKANIAVATTSGKAYYLIVNELKRRNLPFISLTPNEKIPIETRIVITTENEKPLIKHERILVYKDGIEPEKLINEALQILNGKSEYKKLVIGVDPGEIFGLAILADGKVIETENCFSVEETVNKILKFLRNLEKIYVASVSVKVGDGVPAYKEKLLESLDDALPLSVKLESVSEAGTDRYLNKTEHRRGLRDIASAIRIAGRNGQMFLRRKTRD